MFDSVFAEFNRGLKLDADGLLWWTNSPAMADARNNVWDVTTDANSDGQFVFTETERLNTVEAAVLGGISYDPDATLDPRRQATSPVYNDVLAGAPVPVTYRGAFADASDDWADGWTALSSLGYLKPAETVSAPIITTQPESEVNAFPREAVALTVVATGEAPLSYQWLKDGLAIEGTTTAQLTLDDLQPADAGTYAVTVSNSGGSVTSSDSVLTVVSEVYDDWATNIVASMKRHVLHRVFVLAFSLARRQWGQVYIVDNWRG